MSEKKYVAKPASAAVFSYESLTLAHEKVWSVDECEAQEYQQTFRSNEKKSWLTNTREKKANHSNKCFFSEPLVWLD